MFNMRPRRHQLKPPLFVGYDDRNHPVHVESLEQGGKTDLKCPYCSGLLTAKIGEIIVPHFAHSIEAGGCPAAQRYSLVRMPMFDSFDWDLPAKAMLAWRKRATGQALDAKGDFTSRRPKYSRDVLAEGGLMQFNRWRGRGGDWELTKRGQILEGTLSLRLFAEIQEPMLWGRLRDLMEAAKAGGELEQTDLEIYRAQMRRAFLYPLCLIRVEGQNDTYSIGTDTAAHGLVIKLENRAHLHFYFSHRFGNARLSPRRRTTFGFDADQLKSVIAEMKRVPKRQLSETELALLTGTITEEHEGD